MEKQENIPKLEKKLIKQMKKLRKSQRKLDIARFRRKKAEEGKIFEALFGFPKK